MAQSSEKALEKITSLAVTRDIPFNKLVLSQANVRRTKAGVSVEELAEDIARRGLLQNLNVRPVVDATGAETGMYEVPAGGRRFRALEVLVKAKRLAKTVPIPCNVREAASVISAEEDSLAENTQREPLHPLDQFRAFQALVDRGLGEEEIAARFFVTPAVVKQRLRLASVAPALLNVYADDGMTLEMLMAFTVNADHERQLRVWEAVQRSPYRQPYEIRRMMTEGAVRASDRRAEFVGVEAYEQAGGTVLRDLFQADDGGWLQDPVLLDSLANAKLAAEAEAIAGEGWKWIECAFDFPYGHTAGLRRIHGQQRELSEEEQAAYAALTEEVDRLYGEHEGDNDLPDAVDERLGEIETAIDALQNRPMVYDPAEVARAGVFVSIDSVGSLRVDRGYVRPEDEVLPEPTGGNSEPDVASASGAAPARATITVGGQPTGADADAEDDGALRPLSDRLVTELTAHRTLALRDAVAQAPDIAHLAVLHALCLSIFYFYGHNTCLEITAKKTTFGVQAPSLSESASAKALQARHENWARQLPKEPDGLWAALGAFDADSRQALFAHCASLTVNVTVEPFNRRPGAIAHGEELARDVDLDMAAAGWRPTVDNYLGRVPKARILEAVREAKGEQAAQLIDHLKKADMAKEAERLLAGSGWVPEPLRVTSDEAVALETAGEAEALPAFLAGDEEEAANADLDPEPHAIAAE